MDFLVATPCDRHGIMIKFSNCEEGKLSMVKLSCFAKIRKNRESFPLECFDVYGNFWTLMMYNSVCGTSTALKFRDKTYIVTYHTYVCIVPM